MQEGKPKMNTQYQLQSKDHNGLSEATPIFKNLGTAFTKVFEMLDLDVNIDEVLLLQDGAPIYQINRGNGRSFHVRELS